MPSKYYKNNDFPGMAAGGLQVHPTSVNKHAMGGSQRSYNSKITLGLKSMVYVRDLMGHT